MIVFGSLVLDSITLFVLTFLGLYYYATRKFNFWKDRGVTFVKPTPFFGSLKNVVLQRSSIGHELKKFYEQYKGEPYIGIFSFHQPAVIVCDLELVKNVLVKDAQNFVDRVLAMDEHLDPIGSKTMFAMKGQKWKFMRNQLSPTFTSGKMKNMFSLVDHCAKELDTYFDDKHSEGPSIEIKEAAAKFTTDVIASCAFGIDSNTLKDPNAEFRQQLKKVFDFTPYKSLGFFLSFFAPGLLKTFRINCVDSSVNNFVRKTVWNTAKYREEQGITRRDFLDSLIDLKKKTGRAENESGKSSLKLDDDDYAAQAYTFMVAGFETSSSTISFALYELALHSEIQQKLRTEIFEVLEKHNNELSYDAMQDMKYLDMVVNETLRLYPILPFLNRMCLADYKFPAPSGKGTVTIPAGTPVYVPLMGIQHNPEYFPEPEKFDPERFTEENRQNIRPYTHMPFGEGPRFCIGMRFGLMQTKTGLIHILSRYEVSPCKETPFPLNIDQKAFLVATSSGIPLNFNSVRR